MKCGVIPRQEVELRVLCIYRSHTRVAHVPKPPKPASELSTFRRVCIASCANPRVPQCVSRVDFGSPQYFRARLNMVRNQQVS